MPPNTRTSIGPPGQWGHGGDCYRFSVPRHLHEGGVLEEPELGGGNGAVLPDGHGRGGWREWSQGLITWRGDSHEPGGSPCTTAALLSLPCPPPSRVSQCSSHSLVERDWGGHSWEQWGPAHHGAFGQVRTQVLPCGRAGEGLQVGGTMSGMMAWEGDKQDTSGARTALTG